MKRTPLLFPLTLTLLPAAARAQITGQSPNYSLNTGTETRSSYGLSATNDSDTGVSQLTSQRLTQGGGTLNLDVFNLGFGVGTPSQPVNNFGGIYTINAGTANIGAFNVGPAGAYPGHGYVNHNGGTINVTGTLRLGMSQATGSYALNGGSVAAAAVMLGSPSPTYGSSNLGLNGGTLTTSSIGNDSNGYARYLYFNGGTLRAGNSDNPDWIATSLLSAIVDGGAVFDTNGRNMGIAASLTKGATIGGVTKKGEGVLVLSGANAYVGATAIEAGTLSVSAPSHLGASGNELQLLGGTLRITGTTMPDLGNRVLNSATFNGGIDISDASNTFTLPQALSGTGALAKLGAGTLILPTASTRSGPTTLSGGTLLLAHPLALQTSALTLSGGNLGFGQIVTAVLGGIAGNGQVNLSSSTSAPVALSLVIASGSSTFDGSFSGGGSLTKQGAGTLVLGGSNSHSGGTILSAGTLAISNSANLGAASAMFTLSGGTLRILGTGMPNFGSRSINNDSFNGSLEISDASHTFTIDQSLLGSGSLTKLGPGTLAVSAPNSSSGATHLNAGTLSVDNPGYLASGALNFNGGTLRITGASAYNLARNLNGPTFNGSFDISSPNGSLLVGTPLSGSGTLTKKGVGTLVLQSQVSGSPHFTNSGGASIEGGTLEVVDGNFTGPVVVAAGGTFAVNSSGAGNSTGLISGAGGFWKKGAGNHVLSAIQTYTGGTIVDAGTLTLAFGSPIGAIRGNLTINNGATVHMTQTNTLGYANGQKVNSVTLNGGTLAVPASAAATGDQGSGIAYTLNGGTLSSNGGVSSATAVSQFPFTTNSGVPTSVKVTADSIIAGRVHLRADTGTNSDFTVDPGATLLVGAAVTSGGWQAGTEGQPSGFTKLGGGTMRLEGANTYTGDTILAAGTLALGHASALGITGKVIFNGGTLQFTAANANDCSDRFSTAANQSFRFDTNGRAVNFGTVIASSGGSLVKSGDGSLKLSALNTYTGTTTVDKGTLELAAGGGIGCIRGNLTVNSGATLLLTATNALGFLNDVKINNVTLNNGTIAVPASAAATLDQGWGIAYTLNGGTLSSNGGASSTTSTSKFAVGGPTGVPSSFRVTADSTIAGHLDLRTVNGNPSTDFTVDSGANLLVTAGISSDGSTGPSSFRKLGDGTMTLVGKGIYTGATQVKQGLLQVNDGLGNTSVTVSPGASLAGTGSIAGLTTIEAGGRLRSVTPAFTNGLALAAGALIDFEPAADKRVRVSGGTLSGPATGKITINLSGTATAGTVTLIDASEATLSNLSANSFILGTTIPGFTYSIVQTGNLIQLTTVAIPPYDQWSSVITDPAQRDRTADPDSDGFSNLMEYLFGTSPTLPTASLVEGERTAEGLMIRWLQRNSGVSYQLQETSDFATPWPLSTLPVSNGDPTGVPQNYTRKQVLAPLIANGQKFFRIQAAEE